jgi:hypothetical protein
MSKVVFPSLPMITPAGEMLPHLSARRRMEVMDMVFEDIGGVPAMSAWASRDNENRSDFYKMWARGAIRSTNIEVSNAVSPEDIIARLDAGEHAKVISPEPGDE